VRVPCWYDSPPILVSLSWIWLRRRCENSVTAQRRLRVGAGRLVRLALCAGVVGTGQQQLFAAVALYCTASSKLAVCGRAVETEIHM